MGNAKSYDDLYTHRAFSIFPPNAQTAIFEIGNALRDSSVTDEHILAYQRSLRDVPASDISRTADEIRLIARLYPVDYGRNANFWDAPILPADWSKFKHSSPGEFLKAQPDLFWLLLFHSSGYIRQDAIKQLKRAPATEFEMAAILYRMNDWVDQVRTEAAIYASSYFPKTSAQVIGKSAFFLLPYSHQFRRWSNHERKIFEHTLNRSDVLDILHTELLSQRPGQISWLLRWLLKKPGFDHNLQELAQAAAIPIIRAIALDTLLLGQARWYDPNIKGNALARFMERQIDVSTDFETQLEIAAFDKSPKVRRMAADALLRKHQSTSKNMDRIANHLLSDKDAPVRDHIDAYFRKRKDLEETE